MDYDPAFGESALLSEAVVIARLKGADTRASDLHDSFRSTPTFEVTDVLFGNLRPGDTTAFRMSSGRDPPGLVQGDRDPSVPAHLPNALVTGETYVVFLSRGKYQAAAKAYQRTPAGDFHASRQGPMRLSADGATFTDSTGATYALSELRTAVEPLGAITKP
jgi:hypothetical protein